MDEIRFDRVVAALTTARTRRRLGQGFGLMLAGSLGGTDLVRAK